MIEVQAVSKAFEGFQALDKLTMTVPTGSIYGLVGPTARGSPPSSDISPASTSRTAASSWWTGRRSTRTRR